MTPTHLCSGVSWRSACRLTFGFVDILAREKTRAYTPATVVGEAPTRVSDPPVAAALSSRDPSPLPARPPRLLDTHVLNRGLAGVRSPADRMFLS